MVYSYGYAIFPFFGIIRRHSGRHGVKKFPLPVLPMFLLFIPLFPLSGRGQKENKSFSWTLGLQNAKTGELVPFSAPVSSWKGDQFRLVIEPSEDCYCYAIAESSEGDEVSVLYAGFLKAHETWYSPIMILEDPPGAESLFIVVSYGEQEILSQRIAALRPDSISSQRALMSEISRIRGELSGFREVPEKPVMMGGASRGSPEKGQGVEYSGLGAYVKTISIEH